MKPARAAVLENFHQPLRPVEYPICFPLEKGAALVRTEMAGICGTDVHLWKGQLPIALPVILGHETVGRIEELGPGLESDWAGDALEPGDRVTWNSAYSCGQCYYCVTKQLPTRCPHRRAYGIGYRCDQPPHFLGGYAEVHHLRPGTAIHKVHAALPIESVIGAGCALITAIHGLERICLENGSSSKRRSTPPEAEIDAMPMLPALWRDTVVVQGAGPVGLAALAVAKNAGAQRVIVIGAPKHRLGIAQRFGATLTLDLDEVGEAEERIKAVRQLTNGYGADVVIECTGSPSAVAEGVEMCRDGGKYLVLGHYCDAGAMSFNPHLVTRKQLQVFGSWSSEPRHLSAALGFLRARQQEFPFGSIVTHRFSLERADEALQTTARWESGKSVIVPGAASERPDPE